ncbi:MAG: HPF/RaiA family ribosome-associated protein [Bdellovibrionales bacterium]|nr:HPF/RaiA family ribosome-associated protein [Bdellovibrionales bacterium]
MPQATVNAAEVKTVTTYQGFESREHLTRFVEEVVDHSLAKFLNRHETRVEVTLDTERGSRGKTFEVGITLRPARRAPIHVSREADDLHAAVRSAVNTVQKVLRREHAKNLARRRLAKAA